MNMDFLNKFNYSARFQTTRKKYFFPENININADCLTQKKDVSFSSKSSIEKLLDTVKKFQIDLIIKNPEKLNFNNTKALLSLLKDNLSSELNNKRKIYDKIQKQNDKKKRSIRHMIKTNNDNFNNSINYRKETEQLKYINFNIENEIKKIDFTIKEKKALKNLEYLENQDEKIYCDLNDKNIFETIKIMKNEKNILNQIFINLSKEKEKSDNEIKNINDIKSILESKISKRERANLNFDLLYKKSELLCLSKNNSNSYSSDKETNVSSVKNINNNVGNFKGFVHNNFGYLQNDNIYDFDIHKTLKSFHSSIDTEF